MNDWLTDRVQATPQKTAVIIGPQQWNYAELNGLVNHFCVRLEAKGITQGQHIGVLMGNCLEYICLIHALARLGAVLVPLNTRLTATELAGQIAQAECDWVIVASAMADKTKMMGCAHFILNNEWLAAPLAPFTGDQSLFTIQKLQAIVFTSGSSGPPKGVLITFENHFYSAMASAYRLGVQPDDRWLSVLPLYHVGGLAVIFRSCLYGTAVILHDRFHPATVNKSLDSDAPTLISVVPTMLHRLLQQRTHWPDSLRLILLGGAAAPPALIQQANQLAGHPLVATTYGLTEASSQVATMLPADVVAKPGSVGKPLLFTSVSIIDEQGRPLPAGKTGEIIVQGPTVMAGYHNNQTVTLLRLKQGELFTGDMGYLDDDGDLWVVQRRTDMIVSGGENVYPAEVEAVLRAHTAVADVCVVGVPDPEWGQLITAMVQLHDGQTVALPDLLRFSSQHLAGYKQPRRIHFVQQLPQTASGKIARQAVQELMIKESF